MRSYLDRGLTLLFFGYVENYAPFAMSLAIYPWLQILVCNGRIRWWFRRAVFRARWHIFGVVVLPVVVYTIFPHYFAGRNKKLQNVPPVAPVGALVSPWQWSCCRGELVTVCEILARADHCH